MSFRKKGAVVFFSLFLFFSLCLPATSVYAAPDQNSCSDPGSIHFLTLNDNTDAILIECNGKFGMVDSGEDNDYPKGSDSRYPLRSGIIIGHGHETEVISYLESLGVNENNFEFYIGTHPHSDHIGSADEIIRKFHPKRVYIEPYRDDYISLDQGNTWHLWDNLYVYDQMITAAKETNTTLIQYFDPNASLYPETVTVNGTIQFIEDLDILTDITTSSPVFSITLSWKSLQDNTFESKTLFSDELSEDDSLVYLGNGQWSYEFHNIPKYDTNKDIYQYTVIPSSEAYTFTEFLDSAYNFIASPSENSMDTSTLSDASLPFVKTPSGGIVDEDLTPVTFGKSDVLMATFIPEQDQVDANSLLDPTNTDSKESTGSLAQSGIHNGSTGSISTPTFYLGGKNGLRIDIRNYGVYQAVGAQPDANYFCLGVKITSMQTGTTAFLSGDINNYLGAETVLAAELGHIDLLKLGHHGSYGSNTDSYIAALNPDIAVLTGTFSYVSNTCLNNECGTLDTLLHMAQRGTPLYATSWYSTDIPALVFRLDSSLSHDNIPTGKSLVASSSSLAAFYADGYPTATKGWQKDLAGELYYFDHSYLPVKQRFYQLNNKWYYFDSIGHMKTGWIHVNNTYYYMDPSSGAMKTGWLFFNGDYYYLTSSGAMVTGPYTIQNKQYYFNTNGVMTVSSWVNHKYYGPDGAWIPNYTSGSWNHDANGYWYRYNDGSYPANKWANIDGYWYYFNAKGYRVTGWLKLGSTWYYLNPSGAMATGWLKLGSTWYYLLPNGAMATGWLKLGSTWYYLNSNGSMATGWLKLGSTWYYLNSNGSMATGWLKLGSTWYYLLPNGSMATGWLKLGSTWYYLNPSGAMATGWLKLGSTWYYLNPSGSMLKNGRYSINKSYYSFDVSGKWIP